MMITYLLVLLFCCISFAVLSPKKSRHSLSDVLKRRKQLIHNNNLVLTKNGDINTNNNNNNNNIDDDDDIGDVKGGNFKSGFIAIIGNPNVGKSTLLNALLDQQLCIVSPKPQTTRHRILGVKTENNYQLIFSDTPGMVEPAYKLQETMMDNVKAATGDADVILLVTDIYSEPLIDNKIMLKLLNTTKPIIIIINKIDINSNNINNITSIWQNRIPNNKIILTLSAIKLLNINELINNILLYIPYGPKYFPSNTITNRNERFFTTEIIRETILDLYQDEIPYNSEVIIDSFKDKIIDKLSVIEATIIVSKDSQKGIIIGKNGIKLKELGIIARKKLENFLCRNIYLSLHVKCDNDWHIKNDTLYKYGYIEEDDKK